MKNVSNIKAFASNLRAVIVLNREFNLAEKTTAGDTILYRVRKLSNGDYVVEGFRAAFADGRYMSYKDELSKGSLWIGSKRMVMEYLDATERDSVELVPLMMPFHDSKFAEFFINESRPVVELVIEAGAVAAALEEAVA